MANIKANIKNIRKTAKRTKANKANISATKTAIKKARVNKDAKSLSNAYKKVDSSCAKGKIHKNKANRIKSRLAKQSNKANKK
ncbi:MAG: 30S ribosomal protein S20 [Mycoplasmoidaceae bacterium]|nr:30S ribosomal protein S20 [Mycoplasmoidaceae bacterium]MDE7434131.1 30S ribosomal protein S20 [Mycoplasmoidaceae bacterium]